MEQKVGGFKFGKIEREYRPTEEMRLMLRVRCVDR
jgi:hypothetical protein